MEGGGPFNSSNQAQIETSSGGGNWDVNILRYKPCVKNKLSV